MPELEKTESAHITVYGDIEENSIAKALWSSFPEKDLKLLTPDNKEKLEQAAQHSALVIIGLHDANDPNFLLARALQDNRLIVADIAAFCPADIGLDKIEILSRGFDGLIRPGDMHHAAFKKFILQKILKGNRRLAGLIQEEEYRRICDALSCAPASMIVFDADKRAVFVSDHYFRAYPKIAPRLIRGLSVYDSFAMMMQEEGIPLGDPRYERLQKFWHNLEGSIEFTLDNGKTYRLKAVHLPSNRGTVVMGQNISDYQLRNEKLKEQLEVLQSEMQAKKAGKL